MPPRAHTVGRRFPRGDVPSGYFSSQYRQHPFRIEVVDAKRKIHRAFAGSAARRWNRREMRRRPAEVHFCRCRTPERLMRAEVRVVDETQFNSLQQIFRHERPYQRQPESVLQRPPESLDQGDRTLLPARPEPLLHFEPKELSAKDLTRKAASVIGDEVHRPSMPPRGLRDEPAPRIKSPILHKGLPACRSSRRSPRQSPPGPTPTPSPTMWWTRCPRSPTARTSRSTSSPRAASRSSARRSASSGTGPSCRWKRSRPWTSGTSTSSRWARPPTCSR